jgi:hypothetical protein
MNIEVGDNHPVSINGKSMLRERKSFERSMAYKL